MSRLDELIRELCPNGVKHRALKSCVIMQRGTSITKAKSVPGNIPVISGGKEPAFYTNQFNRDGETITIAGSGAGAGYVQYWEIPIFVNDAFSVKGTECLLTKYVYYYLTNIQQRIYDAKKGGGVPHVHISDIEDFSIPVPPLPIQREIVKILDNFTELTAELNQKLTAELLARKKQYEYYTQLLLTNMSGFECCLGDIATAKTGKKPESILDVPTPYEYINAGTSNSGYFTDFNCEGDTTTTPSRGQGGIGFVGFQRNNFWLGPLCYRIKSKDTSKVINRFLYFYLKCFPEKILQYKNEGGTPSLNASDLLSISITVPSIDQQRWIVSILDHFETLCNDLSSGLPAEIAARQKQYEYYRDKLLTFKQLA